MKKLKFSLLTLASVMALVSCSDDDATQVIENTIPDVEEVVPPVVEAVNNTVTFDVTIRNAVNLLNSIVFNTAVGATEAGPIGMVGGQYQTSFKAVPGAKLSFATMNATTNDWFYAPSESGVDLFDGTTPVTGDITSQIRLWDSGTEVDQAVGAGADQPGRQAGPNTGAADSNNTVRVVDTDVTDQISAELSYADGTFTLTLTNLVGADGNVDLTSTDEFASTDFNGGVILTPGVVVLHAQDNPLFLSGTADRGFGLEGIAEDGNVTALNAYLTERVGDSDSGAFLRLSSSLARFSPALAYAFNGAEGATDPVFSQGDSVVEGSGLEELAEDGNRMVAYNYIKDQLQIPVALGDKMMPTGPGGEITFELTVPKEAGYKFSFLTMFVPSNDWFLSHNTAGLDLFDENGEPLTYDRQGTKTYMYDAGTEEDEPVGGGEFQVVSQTGPNVGPADDDTSIRRVASLEDGQFGKGTVSGNGAGVIWNGDSRGGYNLLELSIVPR